MANSQNGVSKPHYLFLDSLRGVAAILVLLLHWFEGNGAGLFGSGILAVDFFFVLSGFVVALAYEDRLLRDSKSARFMRQRLIRLYPMIALGTCLGLLRFSVLSYQETGALFDSELGSQWITGLLLVPFDIEAGVSKFFPLNNAFWSLHFEFVAYLAFWLVLYRSNTAALAAIALIATVGCYLWASITFGAPPLSLGADEGGTNYFHALSRVAFSFGAGVVIYRIKDRFAKAALPGGRWLAVLLVAALTLPRSMVPPVAAMAILAVVFPYVILAGTKVRPGGPWERVDRFLGDLSYPLYALHVPLIWTMSGASKQLGVGFVHDPLLNGIYILPLTLIISYAAFVLYDRPLRRWLTLRFASRQNDAPPPVGAPVF